MDIIVKVQNLKMNFQGEHALNGVSFAVPQGSMFGIIGPDGAGKTTLLQILTTLQSADEGIAEVLSHPVGTGFQYIRRNIGYMPQRFSLYEDLSVMENIDFFADIFGVSGAERKQRTEQLLSFSRLAAFTERIAGKLSGGMKQKLALCCALIHTPRLLILDEPTVGVDPVSREEFWDILKKLKDQGITILVSTPYMNEAAFCDRLALFHKGSILAEGEPQELCERYPLHLFATTEGGAQRFSYLSSLKLPLGIELLYHSRGRLAIASTLSLEETSRTIESLIPGVGSIAAEKPGIEDFFMYRFSKEEEKFKI